MGQPRHRDDFVSPESPSRGRRCLPTFDVYTAPVGWPKVDPKNSQARTGRPRLIVHTYIYGLKAAGKR
jgi:hypothetical protein